MKRILCLLLALMSFASVCFAKLEPPTDERWYIIGGDGDKLDIWLDGYTLEFLRQDERAYSHKGHKMAKAWVMLNSYENQSRYIEFFKFDFTCNTLERIDGSLYDDKGGYIGPLKKDIFPQNPPPGTVMEYIYIIVRDIEELSHDKEKYNEFNKEIVEASKKYRANWGK